MSRTDRNVVVVVVVLLILVGINDLRQNEPKKREIHEIRHMMQRFRTAYSVQYPVIRHMMQWLRAAYVVHTPSYRNRQQIIITCFVNAVSYHVHVCRWQAVVRTKCSRGF